MKTVSAQILLDFLLFASTALAARLAVNISPTQQLPNPYVLPSSTHATLQSHGEPLSAQLTRANKFTFEDVAPGSYLFTVHCRDYAFEPLRIDVESNQTAPGGEYVTAWQTFKGNEWDNKGEIRGHGDGAEEVKIEVRSTGVKDYYQQRQGCEFWSSRTRFSGLPANMDDSFDSIILQEPHDSHGPLLTRDHRWNALLAREYGSGVTRRIRRDPEVQSVGEYESL